MSEDDRDPPVRLSAAETLLVRLERVVAASFFAVLITSVLLQVFSRFVPRLFGESFVISLPWTEELSRFAFIWLLMFGASVGIAYQEHFKLTAIRRVLSPGMKRALMFFVYVVELVFIYVLSRYGFAFSYVVRNQISPALKVSYSLVYVSVPIGAMLMAVHVVLGMFRLLRRPRGLT